MPDTTPSIARFLNIKQAYGPSFFADGEHIAFITDITGIPQAWMVVTPAEGEPVPWPDPLTFEQDRVLEVMCSPVPGDTRVIYGRDAGGNEKTQLFLLDTTTGSEIALTAGYEDASHNPGAWSEAGTQILFAANRRHPGLFDLYVQPLDGAARLVWQNEEPGFLMDMLFSPDGQHALARRMASSFEHELFEIDLTSGTARQLTSAPETVRYEFACYSPDGRSLLVATDRDSDFLHIARLDLATLTWETVLDTSWDVEGFVRSPDGFSLFYAQNVDGASEFYLLDLPTGTSRKMPGLAAGPGVAMVLYAFGASFAPDGRRIAFEFTSSISAGNIYVWELDTDRVFPVTRSSHGGLPVEVFAAPELVHYPTFDTDESGRQIPAWFYRPKQATSQLVPVVIIVHGGPESQFRPRFLFNVQYFLQNGYAVLAPNVRGSTGYGKIYSHLDDVEKRMDSVADLAHAAYWLKQQPGIDSERLVLYGGSYGGFMILSAMTTYPDLWVAGVDIVGISNFVTFLENTSDYRRAHREAEYGSLARNRDFLARISPANHVDQIAAPLLVIHGANDPRVPLSEAEQIVAALRARNIPVDLLVFDDEGHGIIKLKNKLVAYPAMVEFLRTHAPV
jgi:dipeptidyl aminopeptidase/acylaminoacyl peptidase